MKRHFFPIIAIVTISIFLYANTLKNGFVYDDEGTIVNNILIKDLGNLKNLFHKEEYFALSGEGSYRPFVTFTYFIDFALFGLNSWGYHLTNTLLHAINGVLLYIFLTLIIQPQSLSSPQSAALRPFFNPPLLMTLLFITHPVLTEAVNAISFREDLLVFLFYISTLSMYLALRLNRWQTGSRWLIYILSCTAYFLALLSKEMAVTLPLIIICYELIYHHEGKRGLTKLNPMNIGYIGVMVIYLYLRFYYFDNPPQNIRGLIPDIQYWQPLEKALTIPWLILNYLKLTLFPVSLSADYVITPLRSFYSYPFLLSSIALFSLVFAAITARKRRKALSFGILFVVITLIPVYNVVPIINPFAERYIYLPAIGSTIIIGTIIHIILGTRNNNSRLIIFFVILSLYAYQTVKRNTAWIDNYSLWSDTIKKAPNSTWAYNNLGWWCMQAGKFDEAVNAYRTSLSLKNTQKKLHYNIGVIYTKLGRYEEAIYEFQKELSINPNNVRTLLNIGSVYGILGRYELAIQEFRKVLEIEPNNGTALNDIKAASELMRINKPE